MIKNVFVSKKKLEKPYTPRLFELFICCVYTITTIDSDSTIGSGNGSTIGSGMLLNQRLFEFLA